MTKPQVPKGLRDALRAGTLVPVVGSGVSIGPAELPNWSELISGGITYAEESGSCLQVDAAAARALLAQKKYVDAAQKLKALLGAPGGHYPTWLDAVFRRSRDDLKPSRTVDGISDLLCPIVATTNYDDVLEHLLVDRYDSITWRNPGQMLAALKHGASIFHLHGSYHDPESVVLGADNYDELVRNDAYRSVLKTLWIDRTLLFVGCSFDGLTDPDFLSMLKWFSATFPAVAHHHFALMLENTYTPEQRRAWLHDHRIQVVPYGPTHTDLAGKLEEINDGVNSDRAYTRRFSLLRALLKSSDPDAEQQFISTLHGAMVQASSPEIRAAAKALFEQHGDELTRKRNTLVGIQLLARSMISPEVLDRESQSWERGKTTFDGTFREAVRKAAAVLFLVDDELLHALSNRRVAIHQTILNGQCRRMFEHLDKYSDQMQKVGPAAFAKESEYEIENMKRVLVALLAIIEADPYKCFPVPLPGVTTTEPITGSLALMRSFSIEVRRIEVADQPIARLTWHEELRSVYCEVMEGRKVIIGHSSSGAFVWDPTIASPIGEFRVPYDVNTYAGGHLSLNGELQTLISATDGTLHRLINFKQVDAWRPIPGSYLSDMVMLEDGKVFGLVGSKTLPIHELVERGTAIRLDLEELVAQIEAFPILKDLWRKLRDELTERFKDDPNTLALYQDPITDFNFQHGSLGKVAIEGTTYLTFQFQFRLIYQTSLVLILDSRSETLRLVGYWWVPDNLILMNFDMRTQVNGEITLVGALLKTSQQSDDLLISARAAATKEGFIFVTDWSLLNLDCDLLHVAYTGEKSCCAADDQGRLYRVSLSDHRSVEIDQGDGLLIHGLRYAK